MTEGIPVDKKTEERELTSEDREKELLERITVLEEENGTLRRHLEILKRDYLTGAINRRTLDEELEKSLKIIRGEMQDRRLEETSKKLSIIFVDLDHFKHINDTYGHLVGDKVLQKISALLISSVRHTDVVGRYGGEEFVVLLRGADVAFAAKDAEKFRATIEQMDFTDIGIPDLKATASFGIASSEDATDLEGLYSCSDQAAYQAKRNGRNQVVVYQGEPQQS